MFLRLLVLFLLIWVTNVLSPSMKSPPAMRRIDLIVIHCTATRENRRLSEEELDTYHRSLGFSECGYHFYVRRDGSIIAMRPVAKVGAHVSGYNSHSIGVAYEGGLDFLGHPKDTRTVYQRISLQSLVSSLRLDFPNARVVGHRDLSPDLNQNGRIEPEEWMKHCPCFDVETAL